MKPEFSDSKIMRRCAQLGIDYWEAINSPYFTSQGKKPGHCRIQYDAAKKGTTNWGEATRPLEDRDVAPLSETELRQLLASTFGHAEPPPSTQKALDLQESPPDRIATTT